MQRHAAGDTPGSDTDIDPAALAVAERFLAELQVPRRVRFTPSQLAVDVGGSIRSWQREIDAGSIGAVRIPGGWVVTWARLVAYFAKRQNVVTLN